MPTDIPRPLSPNAQLQAENRVLNYFADANPDNDLFVRIDETALDNRALARTIQDRSKVQRISYDRGSGILRVCSMARPIHNAANNLLTRSLVKLIKADFFTEYEETRISTTIDGDVLPSVHIVEGSKKPQAWTKFPDAAIVFGAADEAQVPTVVFEVGFTEAYDDLQNDAAQWLKSLPSVQLVVMIDIREDVKTLRKIRSEKTVLNRLHDLVKRFGNWTSNDEHDSGSESDRSTPDLYSRINDSICSADFVGPLTVHLELWERSDGAPRLRQPAIAILPPPPSPNNPVLRITDIVPRHHLQSEHDTRSAELDMDLYRSLLDVATKKFAYQRAIKYLRPRKHQD